MNDYELNYSESITVNDEIMNIRVLARKCGLPVMLFLHGGPGVCDRHWVIEKQSELAEKFTMVCWDQRGSGKSYNKNIRKQQLTVDDYVEDVEFMLDYLTGKFGVRKVVLEGHSWGSVLGVLAAVRYPDKIAAYIGQGQFVDGWKNEELSHRFCVEEAQKAGEKKTAEKLKANSPVKGEYPSQKAMMLQRDCLVRYGGSDYNHRDGLVKSLLLPLLKTKEYTLGDVAKYARGALYLSDYLWGQVVNYHFGETVKKLEVPVIITQGKHDYNTPSELAKEWFDALDAPFKKWIWFENSAHSPIKEESEKWGREVVAALAEIGIG